MIINFIISLVRLPGQNFNDIASGIIIAVTLYWYIKYDITMLGHIRRSLKKINKGLNQVDGYGIENINKLDAIFNAGVHPALKSIWCNYYADFMNIMHARKSPDMREYFHIHSVVSIPACRKKAEAVPGILTAAGILSTFLGLAIGLSDINISSDAGLQQGLGTLLRGASIAFGTSITAIILSIIFQMLDKHLYHKTVKELYVFHSLVRHKVPITNDASFTALMVEEQKLQTEVLKKLGVDIADRLDVFINHKLVPTMNHTFEDSIKTCVAPSLERMGEMLQQISQVAIKTQGESMKEMADSFMQQLNSRMGNQFQALSKAVQDFAVIHDRMKQNMEFLFNEMKKNTMMQNELSESTSEMAKALVQLQSQLVDISKESNEGFEKMRSSADVLKEIMTSNESMILQINEQRLALQQENNGYFDHINTQMYKLQDDLHSEIESIFARFTDITAETFAKFEQQTSGSMEKLSEDTANVFTHMDEQVFNIGLYAKEISEEIRELNNRLEKSVDEFNLKMYEGVMKTFEGFDEGLGEIYGRFSRTIEAINDSIDDLPGLLGNLKDEIAGTREK